MTSNKKKLLVAISGASGAIYGIRLLEILRQLNIESHVVISKSAHLTIRHETKYSIEQIKKLACYYYNLSDIGSRISCGAFKTCGMIIAPCSIGTLASVAGSIDNNLISRAAGVTLKERRKLVLMVRETPLHLGHIENMLKVTNYGGVIAPPVPAFYNLPQTLDEMINYSISRILDIFDISTGLIERWDGLTVKK